MSNNKSLPSVGKKSNGLDFLIKEIQKTNSIIKDFLSTFDKTLSKIYNNVSVIEVRNDAILDSVKNISNVYTTQQKETKEDKNAPSTLNAEAQREEEQEKQKQHEELMEKFSNLTTLLGKGKKDKEKGGGIMDMIGSFLPLLLGGGILATILTAIGAGILVLLAAAAGAGAGYLIYKMFISPMLEEMQKDVEDALGTKEGMKTKDIKTDTGEAVYSTGKGLITASKLEEQIKNAKTPEEKQQLQAIKDAGPVKETYDAKTGLMTAGVEGVKSGMSIDEMNKGAQAAQEKIATDPKAVAFQRAEDKIVKFDQRFRAEMAALVETWKKNGGVLSSLTGGREIFKEGLASLLDEHMQVINSIRGDRNLTEDQKKDLEENYSPLFEKAIVGGEDPDIDTLTVLGYDLPNGSGMTIDWGSSSDKGGNVRVEEEYGELKSKGKDVLKRIPKLSKSDLVMAAAGDKASEIKDQLPKAAQGALVQPSVGGTAIVVAEAGKKELVLPLGTPEAKEAYNEMAGEILKSLIAVSAIKQTQDTKDASILESAAKSIMNVVNNYVTGGSSTNVNNVNSAVPQESSVNDDNILSQATAGDMAGALPA